MNQRLSLLTVHAHPDDEASKGAPTLAKYSREGVHTVLVCCTGGEEGDLNNPALKEPGQPFHGLDETATKRLLASLRPEELANSAKVIGFSRVEMLGYRDSGMAESPANSNPECFHMADIDEATGRLVKLIREHRPQVMITYGDDQRGYPHPDHLKVHDISVLAFDRAGDGGWYPDAGPAWQPLKMYYSVWSRARLTAVHEALLRLRGSSPYDEKWFERPDLDHRITTRLHIGEFLWARSGALRAHKTQVDETEPFWFGLSDDELADVFPYEDWVLARTLVPSTRREGELEGDLFDGIRTPAHQS
ncbi:MAG: PIG-L family deacetylase [Ilumatobacteraceae bacterium]|jgi:mycothiol S-conjugate amidase